MSRRPLNKARPSVHLVLSLVNCPLISAIMSLYQDVRLKAIKMHPMIKMTCPIMSPEYISEFSWRKNVTDGDGAITFFNDRRVDLKSDN